MSRPPYHLFEAFGVEVEYMIVDAGTLDVRPVADEALKAVAGRIASDVDLPGGITWSNELALHVLELKSTRPLPPLEGWAAEFQKNVRHVNEVLKPLGAQLMPSAMHPWMDPLREVRLWPHEYSPVYEAFNRIFDCRGHGWGNLQSVHLNLPFADDDEFAPLHAAIRFLLPILPALSASSPVVESRVTGSLDTRMDVYRRNSARIPSLAGLIVPEPVFSRAEYDEKIFRRMYADVAPHDPDNVLRDEFLNARGAIARFSRGAIEIRVLDVQECPLADVAICAFIVEVLKLLVAGPAELRDAPTATLFQLLLWVIHEGDNARIDYPDYLRILGAERAATAGQVWRELFDRVGMQLAEEFREPVRMILEHGPLARRILRALGNEPSRERIAAVYGRLCDCLEAGRQFV